MSGGRGRGEVCWHVLVFGVLFVRELNHFEELQVQCQWAGVFEECEYFGTGWLD